MGENNTRNKGKMKNEREMGSVITLPDCPCWKCKNYKKDGECLAFDVIPDEILAGFNKHLKPLKDQKNDIIFKQI